MRDYALHQAEIMGAMPGNGVISRIVSNWRARRAVRFLASLDDQRLQDIGFTRHDVHQALDVPFGQNAAAFLEGRKLSALPRAGVRQSKLLAERPTAP